MNLWSATTRWISQAWNSGREVTLPGGELPAPWEKQLEHEFRTGRARQREILWLTATVVTLCGFAYSMWPRLGEPTKPLAAAMPMADNSGREWVVPRTPPVVISRQAPIKMVSHEEPVPPLMPAPSAAPARPEIKMPGRLHRVGDTVLILARVVDNAGNPVLGEPVEWTLETGSIGRLSAVRGDFDRDPTPANQEADLRFLPTFARTFSARKAYILPMGNESATNQADKDAGAFEVKPGETWCLVRADVAGLMTLSICIPRASNISVREEVCRLHWHRIKVEFPTTLSRGASEPRALIARVQDAETGFPLAGYRVRCGMGSKLADQNKPMDFITDARGEAFVEGRVLDEVHTEVVKAAVVVDDIEPTGGVITLASANLPVEATSLPPAPIAPQLENDPIELQAPAIAPITDWVPISWKIPSGSAADGKLSIHLSDGLESDPPAPAGILLLAMDKSAKCSLRSREPGRRSVRLVVEQSGKITSQAEKQIEFLAPEVKLKRSTSEGWRVGERMEYEITATNVGKLPVPDLEIFDEVPANLVIDETDGMKRPTGIRWWLPKLDPNESKTFRVVASASDSFGPVAINTAARSRGRVAGEIYSRVSAEGVPVLAIELRDLADPAESGSSIIYELRVMNRGKGMAKQARIVFETSDTIEILAIDGDLKRAKADGDMKSVTFDVPAGRVVSATITAKSNSTGDARLSAILLHESLGKSGLRADESTRLVSNEP